MRDREMDRIEELLIDRATGDLSPEAEDELRELLAEGPGYDSDGYERLTGELTAVIAAAETDAAPLPDGLFQEILADGERTVAGGSGTSAFTRRRAWVEWTGWVAAAAAAVGWFLALDRAAPVVDPIRDPTLAEVRQGLVDRQAELLAWTATEDPASVAATGDVVWSDTEQAGVMRIEGLAANDPAVSQYQLWIFDEQRDERYPVDGGVFDVPVEGMEVLVPIQAAVQVERATLFAVTVERPGGVVVSDRERIVLVAQRSGA